MPTEAQEIATITANGQKFDDWETVYIQHRWGESYAHFKFTAAEREGEKSDWQTLRLRPGMKVSIDLAHTHAFNGIITTRQIAYNATQHAVQLIGKTETAYGYKSSVDTATGSFDGKSFQEIAEEVLKPYGKPKIIGTLNPRKFEKCQCQPGETIWDFLERLARPRGIIIGSDHEGNYLLIGDHTAPVNYHLIEGVNIKAMQCIIQFDDKYDRYDVTAQGAGSDEQSGNESNEIRKGVNSKVKPPKSLLITPAEQPTSDEGEVAERAANEALWHEATLFQANVTVYGWLRGESSLWKAGDDVLVKSPMALINMVMKIQQVTFTQDDKNGTQTMLECVPPELFKDIAHYNPNPVVDIPRPAPPPAPPPPPPTPPQPQPPPPSIPGGVP